MSSPETCIVKLSDKVILIESIRYEPAMVKTDAARIIIDMGNDIR